MPGKHAKLSASGSKRWMECPGSIVLEGLFDEQTSEYAEEGTRAHSVAETRLRAYLHPQNGKLAEDVQTLKEATDPEMWAYVGRYVEYCADLCDTLRMKYRVIRAYVEQRVNFSAWVPGGFGTVDFCVLGGDELHVIDLKYGKGVPVSAVDNPQPRLYALGVLSELGTIWDNLKTVTTHIFQPRLNAISTEELQVDELLDWGRAEVKPKAKRAAGMTRCFAPGTHCKFCRARATCKARAETVLGTISHILED